MMKRSLFDKDRTMEAVLYILHKMGGSCDMHKIFKTLYYADRFHMSRYGRSVTGDRYIAMKFGPVPSMTDDIFKAVRGDSFFSDKADDLRKAIAFRNRYIVVPCRKTNQEMLSASDTECLDKAVKLTRDCNFAELTRMSHDIAWQNTSPDREMSVKDIMREAGETEGYAEYIAEKLAIEASLL